jgi:hypothetical protein
LVERFVGPTIPNITDGDTADVAIAADLAWATGAGNPPKRVRASFDGAPLANLGIVGAWVSNVTTGVVTVRCSALTGNVATAAQTLALYEEP